MDLKDYRITMETLPELLRLLGETEDRIARLTEEEKQRLIKRANQMIIEHYGS